MESTRRSRRLRHETPELGLLHPLESPGTQWVSFLDPAIADLSDRRVGLRAVQAFARHRLDRVPFVGCPRSVVLARRQHFDAAQRPARHADMSAFFAYQAGPSAPASPAA